MIPSTPEYLAARARDHALSAAVDDWLIDGLPDRLRAAIDGALAKGATPAEVRRLAKRAGLVPGSVTATALAAYLERQRPGA